MYSALSEDNPTMSDTQPFLSQIREIISGIRKRKDVEEIADYVAYQLMHLYGIEQDPLVVKIGELLADIRNKDNLEESIPLIIEKACEIAGAIHGSFVEVDHENQLLKILSSYGPDWTEEKQQCLLPIGEGLTGIVAKTGKPYLCQDAAHDPHYFPLFDYVKSELVVPVMIDEKVWGLINIDGMEDDSFDENTLHLLTVFAEMVAFSLTLQFHVRNQRKLQEQIVQSEKMASLGRAIAGIAHEINNPLTSILGHASLLMLRNNGDQKTTQSIEAIYHETVRTADLVKGLLAFARKESPKREILGINEIIHAAIGLKKYQLQVDNIHLHLDLNEISYPVEVSPQHIQQVLINLLTNASQAIPKNQRRGNVSITCGRSGDNVLVRISDNGTGIPEGSQKYIFEPFFTTKEPGQGTGLGLSLASTLIENNGGNLSLEKTSHEGTTFLIELPIAVTSKVLETVTQKAKLDLPPENGPILSRILIVDDEPQVTESLKDYLEMHDFTVTCVRSAYSALDMMQSESFDVVVCDIRMPGMDGLELYEKAIKAFPLYRGYFIFMSGDLMRDNILTQIKALQCPWMEKPFLFESMVALIKKTIDQELPVRDTPQEQSTMIPRNSSFVS